MPPIRVEPPVAARDAATTAAPWRREDAGAVILWLYVQPGAKRTEIAGLRTDQREARLKVRLAAPPVEGRANVALRQFLAEAFGVPLAAVRIARGEASRAKTVHIEHPARRPDHAWERAFRP